MNTSWPIRFAWLILLLSALTIVGLSFDLLRTEPYWCAAQREALTGIATALGALAMGVTAILILRQVELQNRQLIYYYQPGVSLQVDFSPTTQEDLDSGGVPVQFVTANQATVFKLNVWGSAGQVHSQRNMAETKQGALEHKDGPGMWWNSGVLRSHAERWALIGPRSDLLDEQTLTVSWHHVTADEWQQEWRLWKGTKGGWCITPSSHPMLVSDHSGGNHCKRSSS